MKNQPPKWANSLVSWLCKDEVSEILLGDIYEVYERNLVQKGKIKANWQFSKDLFGILRPRLVKKLSGDFRMNHFGIFKNHLKTSVRSLQRNALFSGINVFGLAVSLMVGVLMVSILLDLNSYDDFHESKDNIYRVTSTIHRDNGPRKYASSSLYIGQQIKDKISGVDRVVSMQLGWVPKISKDDHSPAVEAQIASSEFFKMFSFELLEGNPATVLSEPFSVVLSKAAAYKLFNDQPAVGKDIRISGDGMSFPGVVSGVYEDIPFNSHLQPKALLSFATIQKQAENNPNHYSRNRESMWITQAYIQVNDKARLPDIQASLLTINEEDNAGGGSQIINELQPLTDIVPSEDYNNQFGPFYSQSLVYIMMALTLVVLVSACFNYTNLSLARALRRSKEVAIRKVSGATRFHVFSQFVTEAMFLAVIAMAFGLIGFYFIRPEVMDLPTDSTYQMFQLELTWRHVLLLVGLAMIVGLVAGLIPAIFLSKLRAKQVFKDASKIKVFSGVSLRQVLIGFQFALAIGLIIFSTVVYKQYHYAIEYDLGYNTENILNIWVDDKNVDLLENELKTLPEVSETAKSMVIMGTSWTQGNHAIAENQMDTFQYYHNHVDHNFFEMHDIKLISGRLFREKSDADSSLSEVVIDQTFVEKIGYTEPSEVIGKYVWCNDEKVKISGVVENFIYSSLSEREVAPFVFREIKKETNMFLLGVKLNTLDLMGTMARIEKIYETVDPVNAFDAEFYDDRIAGTYEEHQVTYKVISFLSLLSISIAILGLLGIAVYTMESRMKEISIRKVLGATAQNLSVMLAKPFAVILMASSILAIPATMWLLEKYVLSDFKYRVDLSLIDALAGAGMVFMIAGITILWQVRAATVQNPADLLRDE